MSFPSQAVPQPLIPVLIPAESDTRACQLARQHPMPDSAQQVYQNLLAVFALKHYLELLGIATDVTSCDCWNSFLRLTLQRADLEVVGHGRLECVVLSSTDLNRMAEVTVPPEIVEERIGYVAIQVEAALEKPGEVTASLVGFVSQTADLPVPLRQLQSMFDFPEFLASQQQQSTLTQLSDWLRGSVEQGWQALDDVLKFAHQPQFQVRGGLSSTEAARRVYGKSLPFSKTHDEEPVALIADIASRADGQYAIELKACPTTEETFLPPGLEMMVMDEAGELVMQAQARQQNRMIELGFLAETGDRFYLKVRLGATEWIEEFVV